MLRHEILINSEKFVIVSPEVLRTDEISMLLSCELTDIESILITHQDEEPTNEEISNAFKEGYNTAINDVIKHLKGGN